MYFTFMHWRRKRQPTPVFLPGESQGWGARWEAVYGVTQSRTRLKRLSSSSSILPHQGKVILIAVNYICVRFLSLNVHMVQSVFRQCDWFGRHSFSLFPTEEPRRAGGIVNFHAGELTWASLPALLGQPEKKTESTRAFQAPFVPHLLMSSWPKQVTCQAHISLGE